ncbi:hypothetical protein WT80_18685 [Burkholderia stagnalis]|nr:hypothetical protein WT80_18685 [Burkholderia stagnalis]
MTASVSSLSNSQGTVRLCWIDDVVAVPSLHAIDADDMSDLIPLLHGGENEHDADEHGEALEPQNQQGFHDHTPIRRSIGGATAPASR